MNEEKRKELRSIYIELKGIFCDYYYELEEILENRKELFLPTIRALLMTEGFYIAKSIPRVVELIQRLEELEKEK